VDDRMMLRQLQITPGPLALLALLMVLVLSSAACGAERASKQGSQAPSTETTTPDKTAAETIEKPADSYCSSGSTEYGYVDLIQPLTEGSEVKADSRVRIGGWAATPDGSPSVEKVEVRVEGEAVGPVRECMAREDLVKTFGKDARYGGWEVTADLSDIEVTGPTVDVSAVAIDRNGGRHPLPRTSQAESELRVAREGPLTTTQYN
jgi:hypothetical protein